MIWREKRLLLIVLGVLLAANTIFFFTYRVQYKNRLQSLDERRHQAEEKLQQARAARTAAEQRYASYQKIQADVQTIYSDEWSTETRRLTALIIEVKRLAVASQLVPKSYSFGRTEQKVKGGGVEARSVTIAFTVQGNYQQARRLINLLELSRQFVIIDQIGLSSSDNQVLTLNLYLKTLFRDATPAKEGASAANQEL
ncbi:MAG: hypothetical protein ACXVH7_00520 [Thermoanaerobaculia bacterium]